MAERIRSTRRSGRGFSLVELLIVVATTGAVVATLSSAIIFVVRNMDSASNRIAGTTDAQNLVTWLPGDVSSTPPGNISTDPTAVSGCASPSEGTSVLLLTWSETLNGSTTNFVANYRAIPSGGGIRVHRLACSGVGVLGPATSGLISNELPPLPPGWVPGQAPVAVTVVGVLVTFTMTQYDGRIVSVDSSQKNPGATLPPISTTSSSAPATTTTTMPATTTTVVATPSAACDLLGTVLSLAASVTAPSAVTTLLTDSGTGALVTSYRVTAAFSLAISLSALGFIDIDAVVCGSVQIAYNTGNTTVVVPANTTATCTSRTLLDVCLTASVSFYVDLQASAAEPWTVGVHSVSLVNAAGNPFTGGVGSVTVDVDPATTTTTIPCTVPSIVLSDTSPRTHSQAPNELQDDVTVTITKSGPCQLLQLEYDTGGSQGLLYQNFPSSGPLVVTLRGFRSGGTEVWTAGPHTLKVIDNTKTAVLNSAVMTVN